MNRQTEITLNGFEVVIETSDELVDVEVGGRPLGAFALNGAYCSEESLDSIVGYVVFDNDVRRMSVTRTDVAVFVGATSYGDAIGLARKDVGPFARGVGTLYRCGHRSY